MPFAPRTWVSNELVTASLLNTELRDVLNLTGPAIVTTKGDLLAASGANALGRLAAASSGFLIPDSGETLGVRWVTPQLATVDTNQSTSSTSYTDLATAGPSITIDVGSSGIAEIWWGARCAATAGGSGGVYVGVRENANDPADAYDAAAALVGDVVGETVMGHQIYTGLTPGNNTFKLRYKVVSGFSGSGRFSYRWIRGCSL